MDVSHQTGAFAAHPAGDGRRAAGRAGTAHRSLCAGLPEGGPRSGQCQRPGSAPGGAAGRGTMLRCGGQLPLQPGLSGRKLRSSGEPRPFYRNL
ncbi:hypothetical protein B5G38_01585 [Gemmiger sp. An87]|nr:hypothetical protein B5G38_01585 [Gemmiger sp. An87]